MSKRINRIVLKFNDEEMSILASIYDRECTQDTPVSVWMRKKILNEYTLSILSECTHDEATDEEDEPIRRKYA